MPPLRYRYETIEFGRTELHLRTLRDTMEYSDDDGVAEELGIGSANWALFGVIWDSSRVLATLMYDYDIEGQRILEVGCGIGLASLVLKQRGADVTATDYHPEAERFLKENLALNGGGEIPFVLASWKDQNKTLGRFDLLIGSDLLYEPDHIEDLASFINQHAEAHCKVIIVDPGRRQLSKFVKKMLSLGFDHEVTELIPVDHLTAPFKGKIQTFTR